MDKKDETILAELVKDARQSTADIARKTGIPRVTVHERIQRLKGGAIKRFTASLDYAKLGLPTTAFVLVAYERGPVTQAKLAKQIAGLEGVSEVHVVAGEWDLLVKIRGSSIEEIGRVVVGKMRSMPGVGKTFTMPAFTSVKDEGTT